VRLRSSMAPLANAKSHMPWKIRRRTLASIAA
jgi:hypothetical protein